MQLKSYYKYTNGLTQINDGSITRLDGFGCFFSGLAGTTITLLLDLIEFAGYVSGVTIQHWGIAVADLTRMVQYDDLKNKHFL